MVTGGGNGPLAPGELALLREIHRADEERGGIGYDELTAEERESVKSLVERGLVELVAGYGEAPDGEEDERDEGGFEGFYRITGAGVDALRDA